MNAATETIVTILTAIVGVAIISVLVSKNSNTAGVLQAAGSAFSNALNVATGPVTGVTSPPVLDYGITNSNIFSGAGSLRMPL